jgi:single-stranded DNA-binding protein
MEVVEVWLRDVDPEQPDLGVRASGLSHTAAPSFPVEGRLQYRTWQTPDGTKRSTVDVVADNEQFLNRSGDLQAHAEHPASVNKAPARTADVGGWGLAAKQQAAGSENGLEELEMEEVENISF